MDSSLVSDLERIVGTQNVSIAPEQIDRFNGDALGVFRAFNAIAKLRATAGAVVWPTTTAEVSRLLSYANRNGIPVVPYGSGTGVMGGATSVDGCIVLNLQRMNNVINVSKEDMAGRVQAGVILENAATAFESEEMLMGHDPWSRPIASVGGAISTNGVGYTAAKYGAMGDQVLGLEIVLPDGEIISTKSIPKATNGTWLTPLFIGTEGTLGVITEATLRGFPLPEKRLLRTIEFPDFESGFRAVAGLYQAGVRPAMIDYGEEPWADDSSEDEGATLYLAFEGFREDVETHDAKAKSVCKDFDGKDGDPEEAKRFWATRHASGERYKRDVLGSLDPGRNRRRQSAYRMEYLHVALPVSKVLEYRRQCKEIFSSRRVIVREWSLWARPEFFSFLIAEENDDTTEETSYSLGETVDRVLTLAQEMGGAMEYCHGVGVKLAHLIENEMDSGVTVLRRMKKALDPNNILNPGKLIA